MELMVEKRTITFKKEEIIAALQDYYNKKEKEKAELSEQEIPSETKFYPTFIAAHNPTSLNIEIELEIDEYELN